MAGPCAEVEHGCRLQPHDVEPLEQAPADFRLHGRGVLQAEFARDLSQAFRFLLMLRLDG